MKVQNDDQVINAKNRAQFIYLRNVMSTSEHNLDHFKMKSFLQVT